MHFSHRLLAPLGLMLCSLSLQAHADSQQVKTLKNDFIQTQAINGVTADEVSRFLEKARHNQAVLDAISRPWEAKPWYKYHPIFLTDKRLQAGLDFWQRHAETIASAAEQFQVDPEMIVAIIGIETFYGQYKGKYSVLDALYTLGFYYPPRAKFFRRELGQLLSLVKEESLDIDSLKGSYAGAMGYGQFIPSSYRHYAVDFDRDGQRDLLGNPVDAIGSVANYFNRHGWQAGQEVALPLNYTGNKQPAAKAWRGEKMDYRVADILSPELALTQARDLNIAQPGLLIALDQQQGKEYWLGLKNFYVITRYNHSPLYAMAAFQFSQQLKQAYAKL